MTASPVTQTSAHDALRLATASSHRSLDQLVDADRLADVRHYVTVMTPILTAAEFVEGLMARADVDIFPSGMAPSCLSKRSAIDSERDFLAALTSLTGAPPESTPTPTGFACLSDLRLDRALLGGLLYVHVGSAFGGLHMLRIVQQQRWWDPARDPVMLRPYGGALQERWCAVLAALEVLGPGGVDKAVRMASVIFDLHRQALGECLRQSDRR